MDDRADAAGRRADESASCPPEKLSKERKALAIGPFGDDGDERGILILAADSPAQARAWESADPLVAAGQFAVQVRPWMGPRDAFQMPAAFLDVEPTWFGYVKKGPTWTPEVTPEIEKLQKLHLAHMARLSSEGTLILAGPFLNGGDLRGIVVYRIRTMEEAKALADADPMVKAGRLQVELHPWMVSKGTLCECRMPNAEGRRGLHSPLIELSRVQSLSAFGIRHLAFQNAFPSLSCSFSR